MKKSLYILATILPLLALPAQAENMTGKDRPTGIISVAGQAEMLLPPRYGQSVGRGAISGCNSSGGIEGKQ